MIKNRWVLEDFEKSLLRKSRVNIQNNFRIVEALYQQALRLGAFPRKNPLKGIEVVIRVAKVINGISKFD